VVLVFGGLPTVPARGFHYTKLLAALVAKKDMLLSHLNNLCHALKFSQTNSKLLGVPKLVPALPSKGIDG